MIMTLDFVAQRYGVLPSALLRHGSSLDVLVADTAQNYRSQQQNKANGIKTPPPELSEKQMKEMIQRVRK